MPPRIDYNRSIYDEIPATLNEIDLAVEFSDKDVNEYYEILLKLHEKIMCTKIIVKTEENKPILAKLES